MKQWRLTGAAAVLLTLALFTGCTPAKEKTANYPAKGIELVVPFAPGGGVDLVARAVGDYLSKEWGQPVVIINKPGGGGAVGAESVLKGAKKDGYTVLADNVSSTSMLQGGMVNPAVKIEDRLFLGRAVLDPIGYAVAADAPWKDMKELTEWVRKNPEELTWTSVGPAGTSAFAVADWLNAVGADFQRTRMVATTGASDSVPKVAGGHAVLAAHTVAELHAMAQAGKIRILGIQAEKRSEYLPDVPTLQEQGITGLTVKWWTGYAVPQGTPQEVVERWEQALAKMAGDPAFQTKLKNLHMEGSYLNSADFAKFIADETAFYTRLAAERGMRK